MFKDFCVILILDDIYKDGIFKLGVDLRNNGLIVGNMMLVYELFDVNGKVVVIGEKVINVVVGEICMVFFD